MKKLIFILFVNLSLFTYSQKTIINIGDLGLKPNSRENATAIVSKAIDLAKSNNVKIIFEKGRYDFWNDGSKEEALNISNTTVIPKRRLAIDLNGLKNIEIEGNESEFIFHGKFQPITIRNCENIVVNNISIDWEIPFSAEAEILEVTNDYFFLKINSKEFPFVIENQKLYFVGEGWKSMWGGEPWNDPMEFDRQTLEVTAETHDDVLGYGWDKKYTAEYVTNDIVKINYNKNSKLVKGNYLVLRHSVRDHCGIFMDRSKNVTLNNINMYNNTGLSYLAQYCENITFRKVDCKPSEKRKIISGHDDGLHFSNCKGNIIIDSCYVSGLMDDAINVHGSYALIDSLIDKHTLIARFPHFQSRGLLWAIAGDKVVAVEEKTMAEIKTLSVESFDFVDDYHFKIKFKEELDNRMKKNDGLENISWEPDVKITNCYLGHHRARGILVSTRGNIIISNNRFNTSGAAIVVPGDMKSYFETGPIRNMEISNNYFSGSCLTSNYMYTDAIITITLDRISDDSCLEKIHKNIIIKDNLFEMFDYPLLYAESVSGLIFKDNLIHYVDTHKPWHENKYTFTLKGCEKVNLRGNIVKNKKWNNTIKLLNTKKIDVVYDSKVLHLEQ